MTIQSPRRIRAFLGVCRIKYLFLCVLSLVVLSSTGCDFVSSASPFSSKKPDHSQGHEAPKPLVIPQAQGSLALPSSSSDGSKSSKADMAGPLGLNTQRLFEERIRDDDDRFDRLEQTVQSLRDEFDAITPSVQRLMDIEKDIQNLVEQLEALLADDGGASPSSRPPPQKQEPSNPVTATQPPQALSPVQTAPSPAPEPVKASVSETKPAAVATVKTSGATLGSIRMADHAGKTRLVLEMGQKLDYMAEIDNAENLMTLTFSSGSLGMDVNSVRKTSKAIKSLSATPMDDGFILAFTLGGTSSILKQGYIPPNKDNPNHRVFIDLAR